MDDFEDGEDQWLRKVGNQNGQEDSLNEILQWVKERGYPQLQEDVLDESLKETIEWLGELEKLVELEVEKAKRTAERLERETSHWEQHWASPKKMKETQQTLTLWRDHFQALGEAREPLRETLRQRWQSSGKQGTPLPLSQEAQAVMATRLPGMALRLRMFPSTFPRLFPESPQSSSGVGVKELKNASDRLMDVSAALLRRSAAQELLLQ